VGRSRELRDNTPKTSKKSAIKHKTEELDEIDNILDSIEKK
jgi:hypothetical protein